MDDKASLQKDSIKSLNPTSFYAQLWVYQTKTDFRQSLICKKGAQILKVFNSISLISYMLIVDKSNGSEDCMPPGCKFQGAPRLNPGYYTVPPLLLWQQVQ